MSTDLQEAPPSTVDELFERSIIDIGIPPCPAILDRFTKEMRCENPDFNRLASIIGTDVGISAGLIKTANSSFFGMRQRMRSVNDALTMLGLKTASRAVAGIILRNTFPHVQNLERFWDSSARIARLSGWLAQYINISGLRADDAYTFGLFRDCGIPVLLGRFKNYENLLVSANHDSVRSFTEIEESRLPTNHAIVGCKLAQSWWLPEEISLAIRHHHDLAVLESASLPLLSRRLVATSQLAEHILQNQRDLSKTMEWPKLGSACLKILDLDEDQLESLYIEAHPIASADV